jgi:uncharacterized membrane protein YdjX (TVP38/TMEM64 family)
MIVVVVLAVLFVAPHVRVANWAEHLEVGVKNAGPLGGPAIFLGAYAVGAVVLIPATAMNLTGGFLFGPWWGAAFVSVASTLGSGVAFLLARTVLRHRVEEKVAADRRWTALDRAVTRRGAWVVLLIRLNPVVPFNVANYAFGLTGVGLGPYLLASWIGLCPATFAGVIVGATTRQGGMGGWTFWAIAAIMSLVSIVLIGRIAARALAEIEAEPETLAEPVGCPSPGSTPLP